MATRTFNGFIDLPQSTVDVEIVIAGRTEEELRRRQIFFNTPPPYKAFYGFIDFPLPKELRGSDNLVWPTGAQRFGNES